ncbi:ABC1 kinase family protein [Motilimonas pumila]|uniref:AarF/ABC1/UbiB kinase family protein n=1 Tax=Motilimonas pumila TaxID=2303987 RepID=A0A418YAQ6_9GAMM|nr:AarF/ABC1/UbiB kinase family protein [Motilimonas pumila]RJG40040.1 AarF/ABC1/UbiB kinase family protein [Motilimonas pumila]
MTDKKGTKVPTSRFARLSKLGSLAAKVAGNVMLEGAKQVSKGQSPKLDQLVLQPRNIEQLADKLSHLRGAAMKLGQLLSMDGGDLLPEDLSQLLAKLRADAQPMLHKQLVQLLEQEWGTQWVDNFSHFELRPFASASIGQVHLAYDEQVKKLAVKVQYPGVKASIGSDVDNLVTLLRISGLLPQQLDLTPLFEEAKQQLIAEADYEQEAEYVAAYRAKLTTDKFTLPKVNTEISNGNILVMSYVEGVDIDQTVDLSQACRDNIATSLIDLFFKELFDFCLMQTDPNFANYRYQQDSQKIGLLDFGATRKIPVHISEGYKALIAAGADNDETAMYQGAKKIGFFNQDIDPEYLSKVLKLFALACEPIRASSEYDFGQSDLAQKIKHTGMSINKDKSEWHTPPVDALFIHRKLAGLYLLATKLKAKVNVNQLFAPYRGL